MEVKSAARKTARSTNGSAEIDSKTMLRVLERVQHGDFSARMPSASPRGSASRVAAALNAVIESNQRLEREIHRLTRSIGKEGQLKRAATGEVGAWAPTLEAVNDLVEDLARPNTEIARVISAVANGDLSQTMALEIDSRPLQGQFLNTAKTVNTMVEQLNAFASEVTRVAREVGTEGNLGGQAEVKSVAGVWKHLTDNVHLLAGNPSRHAPDIAVANAGLSQSVALEMDSRALRGQILKPEKTVNTMVEQLNAFAKEVTRVAREVGTEGQLGGQA